MVKLHLILVLCAVTLDVLQAEKGNVTKNDSEVSGRSGRYGFADTYENRLPPAASYEDVFQDSPGLYPEFAADRSDRYVNNERKPPYEIPSGFDQFVPDKGSKYSYGPGGFYLPYSPNVKPDYAIEEVENRNKVTQSPSTKAPKSKDTFLSTLKNIFVDEPDSSEVEERPTLLSGIKQLLADPLVALVAIVIPLGFLLANFIPFVSKMATKSGLVPAVTTTVANTIARGLESPVAEEILKAIDDFGARMAKDQRCLQRAFCQAAKAHIESRSGDSWSAQKIVRKLVKAVDDKLWEAMGLKMLFRSMQSGQCDNLPCSGDFKAFTDMPLIHTLLKLLSKLFNLTKTEVL